jgi:hypothetical protein
MKMSATVTAEAARQRALPTRASAREAWRAEVAPLLENGWMETSPGEFEKGDEHWSYPFEAFLRQNDHPYAVLWMKQRKAQARVNHWRRIRALQGNAKPPESVQDRDRRNRGRADARSGRQTRTTRRVTIGRSKASASATRSSRSPDDSEPDPLASRPRGSERVAVGGLTGWSR